MTYNTEQFRLNLLRKGGWPATADNLAVLKAWGEAEGSDARFNPLDTTMPWPGATDYNTVGVKNYRTFADGVNATFGTLHLHYYDSIRAALQRGNDAYAVAHAVEVSPWGTHGVTARLHADGWQAGGGSTPGHTETDRIMAELPTLKVGASGLGVKRVQALLFAAGHSVAMDGHFGPATEQAVHAVQSQGGVTSDGVVGPRTWAVLLGVSP